MERERERELSELFAILRKVTYRKFLLTLLGLYGCEMKVKSQVFTALKSA